MERTGGGRSSSDEWGGLEGVGRGRTSGADADRTVSDWKRWGGLEGKFYSLLFILGGCKGEITANVRIKYKTRHLNGNHWIFSLRDNKVVEADSFIYKTEDYTIVIS